MTSTVALTVLTVATGIRISIQTLRKTSYCRIDQCTLLWPWNIATVASSLLNTMSTGTIMISKEFYGLMTSYFVWIAMMVIGVYRERETSDSRTAAILNTVIPHNCHAVTCHKERVPNQCPLHRWATGTFWKALCGRHWCQFYVDRWQCQTSSRVNFKEAKSTQHFSWT